MSATDEDWTCIGEGKLGCGAIGPMTTGRPGFNGPKVEAMGVMGPFDSFLQLTGKVAGDKSNCPERPAGRQDACTPAGRPGYPAEAPDSSQKEQLSRKLRK